MSGRHVSAALRLQVRQRAAGCCEYCLVHEDYVIAPHEPDHITAEQHGGPTSSENLAFACFHCNRLKGTHLARMAQLRLNQLPQTPQELLEQQNAAPIPLPALSDELGEPPPEATVSRARAREMADADRLPTWIPGAIY